MILMAAMSLSLIFLVSFDQLSTGFIVATLWALASMLAFQSPGIM